MAKDRPKRITVTLVDATDRSTSTVAEADEAKSRVAMRED
jgi:hypothetical protein